MKNPIPFIIALLCIQFMFRQASAQFGCTCLPEGITFTSQEQIDNFQADYPGCTEILGDVIISGNGIQNLNGLSCLISFHGSLYIERTSLIKLTGLDSVQYIGGDFRIFVNEKLIGLNGLYALDSIIGSFRIITNIKLMTTSAMENLAYVGGDLWISFNEISDLTGFINLNYIGGKLGIRYEPLESLAGLENLTYIGGGLSVEGLNLTDLTGLINVTVISGNLLIAYTTLTSLTGLENLTAGFIEKLIISDNPLLSDCQIESICEYLAAPNGVLTIARNAFGCNSVVELSLSCGGSMPCLPYGDYYFSTQADVDSFQSAFPDCTELEGSVLLTSGINNLNGLNSVTSIQGNLGIHGTGINNLVGLGSITSIGGDLKMSWNDNLYDLLGFENLALVNGSLVLESTHLQNLAGLESLSNVGGDIFIQENFYLESLIGLDNLDSIGGSLKLYQNDSLTSLAGLQSLNIIEGNLELGKSPGCSGIGGNPLLSDLSGLNNLNTVNGDMNVMYNYSIINLEGLGNIASIGGSLTIGGNDSLTSLAGIENIAPGSITDLTIQNNASLSACEVQSICDYLATPNGTVTISNNAPGCNSPEEVEEACLGVGEDELPVPPGSGFRVVAYPNPVPDQLTLDCSSVEETIEQVAICNIFGALVGVYPISGQQAIITLDMSGLPAGIYFYRLSAKGSAGFYAGKIIKH
ncbi:MAG: T9SS type A sorting domain-containing protein [Bacteroidales bacterium]|nr:T9SS type A sorting domain-containing protein [Bacteroidales bacterium]